jgi:hypothetical protein
MFQGPQTNKDATRTQRAVEILFFAGIASVTVVTTAKRAIGLSQGAEITIGK